MVADDQQNIAGTIIVVPLSFPMDRGKFGLVWPRVRTFDGDAQTFQNFGKSIQIFFGLFKNLLRKRTARNFGQ